MDVVNTVVILKSYYQFDVHESKYHACFYLFQGKNKVSSSKIYQECSSFVSFMQGNVGIFFFF